MDEPKNVSFLLYKGITCILKWIRRMLFIILAASMIGFTNAFNHEYKYINDSKQIDDQEQVVNNEDK